jgi:hypothetical protein
LSASKCAFVSGLFPLLSEDSSKSSKFSSIGSRFKVKMASSQFFNRISLESSLNIFSNYDINAATIAISLGNSECN